MQNLFVEYLFCCRLLAKKTKIPNGFNQRQAEGLGQISEGWSGIDEARIDGAQPWKRP